MHLYTVCKVLETLPHSKTSTSSMHNQKSTSAVRQVIQVIFQPLLFEVYFGPPLLHQALHFSKAPALTFKNWLFSALQSPPNARVQIFFEPQMLADFSSLYLTAQIFRHHSLLITKRDSCIFFDLCQYQLSFFFRQNWKTPKRMGYKIHCMCTHVYFLMPPSQWSQVSWREVLTVERNPAPTHSHSYCMAAWWWW